MSWLAVTSAVNVVISGAAHLGDAARPRLVAGVAGGLCQVLLN
ncbi:hypothetical protein [Nonomuraea jabiensis]